KPLSQNATTTARVGPIRNLKFSRTRTRRSILGNFWAALALDGSISSLVGLDAAAFQRLAWAGRTRAFLSGASEGRMTATSILPGGYEAPIQIELTADALAPGSAVPYEFHVNDRVSELFRAEVLCACEDDASVASDLIGEEAQLSFVLSNETPRLVH